MSDADAENVNETSVHAVVDRIEDGRIAVLLVGDDEKLTLDVPLVMLPPEASDGDHLTIKFSIKRSSKARAQERISKLQQKLGQRGGDGGNTHFKL